MPQFQLIGEDGKSYDLHSSDPETIGRWFSETLSRFSGSFPRGPVFQLRIWPLWVPSPDGRGRPDWCQDAAHGWCHQLQFDGTMAGLVAILTREIEASQ